MTKDSAILAKLVRNMHRRGSDPLRPMLDAYLMERDASPVRYSGEVDMAPRPRPPGCISPSSLCGCERQAAFKFIGVKGRRKLDPDQQLIFDDGDWRHHRWQFTFRDMEAVLGPERFKVISIEERVKYASLYIEGSLDALLRIEGQRLLVDIKGINDAGFHYVLSRDEPIEAHVRQLVGYLRARRVAKGFLWYDNKNNQLTKAFMVNYDDGAWAQIEGWSESVVSYLRRRRLPPKHPECNRGTLFYGKCPYAMLCFGNRTDAQVQREAFAEFPGVEEAWQERQRNHT